MALDFACFAVQCNGRVTKFLGIGRTPLLPDENTVVEHRPGAGFTDIHLQLHIDVVPSLITSWETFLGSSPHPWAPTLAAVFAEQFSPEEQRLFEETVRPTVESGKNLAIDRIAYLNAGKPAIA